MKLSLPRGSLVLTTLVAALSLGGLLVHGFDATAEPRGDRAGHHRDSGGRRRSPAGRSSSGGGGAPRKTAKPPAAARSAAPDSAAVTAPERAPTVTIRLSAQDRAAREAQYRENVDRAVRSLALVRGRVLSKTDQEELSAADQFLADARRAFDASDLTRACTVAEKARVLAEELRGRLAPP